MIKREINQLSDVYSIASENDNLVNVTIELCNICNWRCEHCYIPSHTEHGISKEKVFSLLEELRQLGCYEIIFTGGELFLREDVMGIIRKAREMNFNVILYTNVSLLTDEKVKELSTLYVDRISCTIFSMKEEIHDSITRVKGSYKKAMENIMVIKKYNIPLEIKTILMKKNYNSYKEVKMFCDENGFAYNVDFNIFSKRNGNSDPCKLRLSDDQFNEVIYDLDKIRGYKSKIREKDQLVCEDLKISLFIDAYGNVYPCVQLMECVGNVYNTRLFDIWYNSEKLKKIKNIKWGDLKDCMDCKNNKYCVKCPGSALREGGTFYSKALSSCKNAEMRSRLYNE